ncbi:LAGLIDADG family homing endonuclease [Paenibacillus agricola]|uniref:DOD-type homing endonuclease domain-containing protein n=1 Tax=Paenibacillus agricola TaxID=2716264 RepID=A0ABX0J0D4_9BACL|nr:LAGLIDADG family homing endonuclease [Paenibacillus agricola]NHN28549.1 hypothetical protein [Paenibacillus agricola]
MKFTKEQLEQLYIEQGLSLKKIGDLIGETKDYVMWRMRKYGVPRRTLDLSNAYELTKVELTDLYVAQQISQKDIARKIGRSQCYVRARMKEYNIQARDSGIAQAMKRGIPFKEDFFDAWNPEMAYVLGLLFADGNLSDNRFRLQLQEKDKQHVLDVAALLGIDSAYIFRCRSKQFGTFSYGFSVSRRDVARRLIELGLTPKKSKTMLFPEVPEQYMSHFIRGYFDGDGSICISSKQLLVQFSCGSVAFSERLRSILSKALKHDVKMRVDKRTNSYNVAFHSTRLGKLFYKYLYTRSTIHLKRKKDKF